MSIVKIGPFHQGSSFRPKWAWKENTLTFVLPWKEKLIASSVVTSLHSSPRSPTSPPLTTSSAPPSNPYLYYVLGQRFLSLFIYIYMCVCVFLSLSLRFEIQFSTWVCCFFLFSSETPFLIVIQHMGLINWILFVSRSIEFANWVFLPMFNGVLDWFVQSIERFTTWDNLEKESHWKSP